MTYPNRAPRPPVNPRAAQVDALAGGQGKGGAQAAAVTRADPAALGQIVLQCNTVTAAPTAAQHNALVADIRALAALLQAMGGDIVIT